MDNFYSSAGIVLGVFVALLIIVIIIISILVIKNRTKKTGEKEKSVRNEMVEMNKTALEDTDEQKVAT